jgi:hypothetical protein
MHLNKVLPHIPLEILTALEKEFSNLESRFARRDWGPAELDGGRMAEALFRFLEWKVSGGTYTPIGTQLNSQVISHRVENNPALPDGLRFLVLQSATMLLGVRNKRDVGHLGKAINVNEMDSRLVLRLASWALAEIIRQETMVIPEEAQKIVDQLSSKNLSLVEEIGGEMVVVATHLGMPERSLIALYQSYPRPIKVNVLRSAVKHSHTTKYRRLLEKEAKNGLVHLIGDDVYLTAKGAAWVDRNIALDLKI